MGGDLVDVLVRDGVIERVEAGISLPTTGVDVLEGNARVLIPGLVDGHTHLDKTFWGLTWRGHEPVANLSERIWAERRLRRESRTSAETQSLRLARQAISRGTTHIRTHVDIDEEIGLTHFEGVMRVREHLRDAIDIQVVAFPQSGLLTSPETVELVEEALKQGADVVGGLDPATIDGDPVRQIETVCSFAERYGLPLDIHLHDPGDLGAFEIELIAARAAAFGLEGRIAISHAYCLGMVNERRFAQLAELLRERRIAIMTAGRGQGPFPPIRQLTEAGVTVFAGSDNVRDAWSPYGNADMLERAWLLSYRSGFNTDTDIELALELATTRAASAIGVNEYGVEAGCRADLVLTDSGSIVEAIIDREPRAYVIKGGRVVASDGHCLV